MRMGTENQSHFSKKINLLGSIMNSTIMGIKELKESFLKRKKRIQIFIKSKVFGMKITIKKLLMGMVFMKKKKMIFIPLVKLKTD
jgi:hypothetical protein